MDMAKGVQPLEGHLEAKHEEKNLNPTSSTKPASHKPSKPSHGNHFNQCD